MSSGCNEQIQRGARIVQQVAGDEGKFLRYLVPDVDAHDMIVGLEFGDEFEWVQFVSSYAEPLPGPAHGGALAQFGWPRGISHNP